MAGLSAQDVAGKSSYKDRSVRRASSKREGRLSESWATAKPGEYSDVLRVIGHFLDEEGASEIEIVDQGAFLSAAWRDKRDSRQERHYHAFELDRLRVDARARRTSGGVTPGLSNEEILRALGRECDRRRIEVCSINEGPEGFHVSGLIEGKLHNHTYTPGEVTRLIVEQRARRGTGQDRTQERTVSLALAMR